MLTVLALLFGESFLEEFVIFLGVIGLGGMTGAEMRVADDGVTLEKREEEVAFAFADEERTVRFLAPGELHVRWELAVALHGGVEAVAVQLVDEVFGFFETVADEDAFAVIVDLKHVKFGFLTGPAEDFLKDVGDVIHEVDGIVPANNEIARFVAVAGFLLRSLGWQDQRFDGRWHRRKG